MLFSTAICHIQGHNMMGIHNMTQDPWPSCMYERDEPKMTDVQFFIPNVLAKSWWTGSNCGWMFCLELSEQFAWMTFNKPYCVWQKHIAY